MKTGIQLALNMAIEALAFNEVEFKDAKRGAKALKKNLQNALKENEEYMAVKIQDDGLKIKSKTISETRADLKDQMEGMMAELPEYEELQKFEQKIEKAHVKKKDDILSDLSGSLVKEGMAAKGEWKSKQLVLTIINTGNE